MQRRLSSLFAILATFATSLWAEEAVPPKILYIGSSAVAPVVNPNEPPAQQYQAPLLELSPQQFQELVKRVFPTAPPEPMTTPTAPVVTRFSTGGVIIWNRAVPATTVTEQAEKNGSKLDRLETKLAPLSPSGIQLIVGEIPDYAAPHPAAKDNPPKFNSLVPRYTPLIGGGREMRFVEPRQMLAAAKAHLKERVHQQAKIAKESRKLLEKLDTLNEDNPRETHEIMEKLTQLQGQLRQTIDTPGAPPGGMPGPFGMPMMPGMPGLMLGPPRAEFGGHELLNQVQELRHQMEEVQDTLRKLQESAKR